MDFCPVGLTVQGSRFPRAESSMLSQLSFEAGLADRLTDFTDGSLTDFTDRWSEDSASPTLVDRWLCSAVEAFEGEASAGHTQQQQDNYSSSTSSKTRLQPAKALQIREGKRKAVAGNYGDESTMPYSTTSSGKELRMQFSEGQNDIHAKFSKAGGDEGKSTSAEERSTSELVQSRGSSSPPKSLMKASSKLLQGELLHSHPKQDYIHVRARRGQATDSHSLAERVRREKIGERMKFLQDLVPGCSKVTGKAMMLDEIINYVQSLQRQIEFLSMKLAAVDPQLDINLETLLNKGTQELFAAGQARSPETTLLGPDPGAGYREFQAQLQLLQHINNTGNMNIRMEDVRSSDIDSNYAPPVHLQLPPLQYSEGFVDPLSQTLNGVVCDGDLQTIVHMANSQAGRSEFLSQDQLHGPGMFSPGFLKVEY